MKSKRWFSWFMIMAFALCFMFPSPALTAGEGEITEPPSVMSVAGAVYEEPGAVLNLGELAGRSSPAGPISVAQSVYGFVYGDGSEMNPYQIETAEQLELVRQHLDKHFKLMNDISLSGYANWEPIGVLDPNMFGNGGHSAIAFSGSFDGNNKTISNLRINQPEDVGVGLFGTVSADAAIKNLTVENASVTSYWCAGGIIGLNFGTAEKLTLTGENTISGFNCIGGIIGGHQDGSVKNGTVEDATINVLGDNDFSSGPIIQADVAECGGLIIGGAFGGSIESCTARGEIIALGNEPVGLGGIGGCLEYMESITGCTADVTITAPNSAHAVGGLCGYAGTGNTAQPALITNCSAQFVMNTANATHIGGLVGTGLYYMGMETVFSISDCQAQGQINDAITPGTIARRAENCTITNCTSNVLIDGEPGTAEIGTTERMYESADQPEGFEDLSAWANNGSGSFESVVNYVYDEALSHVWNAAASSQMAQMMAGMFGVEVTDGPSLKAMFANMASVPANDGTPIHQIKFGYDYKTINFCGQADNVIESHPYKFVEINDHLGMLTGEDVYVFKADDAAGVLTYMAMLKPGFDLGMDEATMPAHFHFYYAAAKDALGTYQPDSVTLSAWMPTMLQMGDEFSTADKTALLECLFGIYGSSDDDGGGGGGGSSSQAVRSTSGTATLTPGHGGTVSLGNEATIVIPANALKGTDKVEIKIKKVSQPPAAPAGFKLAGTVYQFSVDGADSYSFARDVTLKISFDPDLIAPGETPTLQYYDQTRDQWVDIGGSVSGNLVIASVDHFTQFAVMAAVKEAEEEKTQPSPEVSGKAFNDITGHWAFGNIRKLVELNAISGYPDGSFRPDSSITRAEFATVLAQAFKLAPQDGGRTFADTADHWARNYIAALVAEGIVGGYDASTFAPDDLITREQMAVMIAKAAGLSPAAEETSFADRGSISAWAREALAAVVKNGIMTGYPDNTVRPQANATRAEATTVIVQALN